MVQRPRFGFNIPTGKFGRKGQKVRVEAQRVAYACDDVLRGQTAWCIRNAVLDHAAAPVVLMRIATARGEFVAKHSVEM